MPSISLEHMGHHAVAVVLGSGYAGEDVHHKQWLFQTPGIKIHAISRITPERLRTAPSLPVRGLDKQELVGVYEEFRRQCDSFCDVNAEVNARLARNPDELIVEAEQFLDRPIESLICLDRRFWHSKRHARNARPAAAAIVLAIRDALSSIRPHALMTTIEDDLFCVAAVYVARRLNIPVIEFTWSRFPRKGFMFNLDFQRQIQWTDVPSDLDHVVSLFAKEGIHGNRSDSVMGTYWNLRSLPDRIRDTGFFISFNRFRASIIRQAPADRFIIPPARPIRRMAAHICQIFRRVLNRRLVKKIDIDEPYVLFPIHYSDDAQLTFREPGIDQFDLIETVLDALPAGMLLCVKPHPHWSGTDVPHRRLRRLAKDPRVCIVPPEKSPQSLVQGAKAVITINSTTGLEALALGTPVITTGHDFYCHEPPCQVVRQPEEMASAIRNALHHNNPKIGQRFIALAHANIAWAEYEMDRYGHTTLNGEDESSIGSAFAKVLDQLPMTSFEEPVHHDL